MFICIEHEQKPLKLKEAKVVPALIGTLDKGSLLPGTYISLHSGMKVKLINAGGFLQAAPHLRSVYAVANIRPTTLGEEAAALKNRELFIRKNGEAHVGSFSFDLLVHDLRKEDEELLRDFWIPGTFTYANERTRGWVNMKDKALLLEDCLILSCETEDLFFKSLYPFNAQHLTFILPKGSFR